MTSPTVRSIRDLATFRRYIDPFRELAGKRGRGRSSIIWRYGILELEAVWERFQKAVAEMWDKSDTSRGAVILQRMHDGYQSQASMRHQHLQYWEREHMCMNDKLEHQPSRFCLRAANQHSALDKLPLVRKLLLRWQKALKCQEQQLRDRQRRLQVLKRRKRAREERMRREVLRKRMKCDLTMDEILGALALVQTLWHFNSQPGKNG